MDSFHWNNNNKITLPFVKNILPPTLYANRRVRIVQNKPIHIRRFLPGKGSLRVLKNQEVSPEDIIGFSTVNAGFAAVNISRELGINPQEGAQYLQRGIGKTIFKGELLAFKKSLLSKKILTSPTDGLIEKYDSKSGELIIKFLSKETPLTSGVYGIVDFVDNANNEVLIKTLAVQLFGIIGSGKERSGILTVIGGRGGLVDPKLINKNLSRQIVVSGGLIYGPTLRKAAAFGVAGIVCGGYNVADYQSIAGTLLPQNKLGTDVGLSIIATEGFGSIPIGTDIFDIIRSYEGKFVFANGNIGQILLPSQNRDSILTLRKISLPVLPLSKIGALRPDLELAQLKNGMRVRIIWPPYMGEQGKIIKIDASPTVLESGISTFLLTVELPNSKIKVPYPNVEVIV